MKIDECFSNIESVKQPMIKKFKTVIDVFIYSNEKNYAAIAYSTALHSLDEIH